MKRGSVLQLRCSPGELDVQGSLSEWKELRENILSFLAGGGSGELNVPCDQETSPEPYQFSPKSFRLKCGKGLNNFEATEEVVRLVGSPECLANFAENVPWDVEVKPGGIEYHVHYDSISSPVEESSPDVTLTLRQEK